MLEHPESRDPLDVKVLRLLARQGMVNEPGIAAAVRLGSEGRLAMPPEILARALEGLAAQGLIRAHWAVTDPGRRKFRVTAAGRQWIEGHDRPRYPFPLWLLLRTRRHNGAGAANPFLPRGRPASASHAMTSSSGIRLPSVIRLSAITPSPTHFSIPSWPR
jgi:hypothetical protein